MKILVDMNLSPRWVDFFAMQNIEAVHWMTIGAANASDTEIMAYAGDHDYIIFTHDLDFGAILAVSLISKPSVIQLRTSDISPDGSSGLVIKAIRNLQEDLENGAIMTIDNNKIRLHNLPF
jgi:predicted nuclease of predicted toxin-antitoxin system